MKLPEERLRHFATDRFMQHLGMRLVDATLGAATVEMTVTDDMLNFHGTANGGAVFALADVAFAVASNSHGVPAVGVQMTISYMAPAGAGDRLVATAMEERRTRRLAWYRIEVRRDETLLALAHGLVYRMEADLPEEVRPDAATKPREKGGTR
ncbi:MAG: Phenylacetic acid degradation protein PaaD, thioesterase [Hydrogenibacillus schlegelii]|uniref:Phenylacetic acid degradation protein PaaD, thioesterase n=1 Tax=Hydrogenibacillus schlegelii TaxID=1484 RepID=A0A2T5G832_HYDSH|nr:hydroxyphenylacetyl-CoA thioesterase PaaI [Hydrogenibacillus schlegelii]PTQ52329.1 MAG: Phenylacetic acid degradation protein PaaD, thioesterase [Hydrogenibacillus schlegelii]